MSEENKGIYDFNVDRTQEGWLVEHLSTVSDFLGTEGQVILEAVAVDEGGLVTTYRVEASGVELQLTELQETFPGFEPEFINEEEDETTTAYVG